MVPLRDPRQSKRPYHNVGVSGSRPDGSKNEIKYSPKHVNIKKSGILVEYVKPVGNR